MKTSTICERAELYGMEEPKDELFDEVSKKKGEGYARAALGNELTRLILEQAQDDGRLEQELFGNRHDLNRDRLSNGMQDICGLNTFRTIKNAGRTETYKGRVTVKMHTIPLDQHRTIDNANYFEAEARTAEPTNRPCDSESCEGCEVANCPSFRSIGSCRLTSEIHGGKVFHFTNLYSHRGVKESVKNLMHRK